MFSSLVDDAAAVVVVVDVDDDILLDNNRLMIAAFVVVVAAVVVVDDSVVDKYRANSFQRTSPRSVLRRLFRLHGIVLWMHDVRFSRRFVHTPTTVRRYLDYHHCRYYCYHPTNIVYDSLKI